MPKSGGEEKHVPDAATLVPDSRATHYWDPGDLMRRYTSVLSIPEDAWDIYMVYKPGVRWAGTEPPKPDYWMHQLGSRTKPRVNGPYLDPKVFADKVGALLRAPASGP